MALSRTASALALLSAALLALGSAARALEVVDCPKVLPDRAVDTSSLENIIRDVVKPGMTNQEKFLALYNFYRRMVFHHRYMAEDRREILAVINSYGCLLCGSQAGSFSILLRKAGFNTRVVQVSAKGYGGHTVLEVEYDGAWHGLDTMTGFYVLNRKGVVASFAEMKADPTLLTDAVKDKRAPKEYCFCSREFEKEQEGIEALMKADRPWSLLRWGKEKDGRDRTVAGFWEKAVANYSTQEGTYGGNVVDGRLEIALKPNEEYVRLWDNVGLWLKAPSFADFGPFHTCGHADEFDEPLFRYFEPYKRTDLRFVKCSYRYYGNGWLEWKPDGGKREVEAAATGVTNLEADPASGAFKPVKADAAASFVVPMKSPYAMVRVEMDLGLEQADGAETVVSVGPAVEKDGRRTAQLARVWEKKGKASGVEKIVYTNEARPIYLYDIKVETKGGATRLAVARVKTIFQLNWASLPSLYPGENAVTVSAKGPAQLQEHRLAVTYDWADGADWKTERTDTQTIAALPYTYKLTTEAAKEKMPRMKRLVMRVVPK